MSIAKQLVYADSEAQFFDHWDALYQTPEGKRYEKYTRYLTTMIEKRKEWSIMYRAGSLLRGHQTNNFAEANIAIIKDVILNRCKAYNTTQLLIFMNEIYDKYMQTCLCDVALG